MNVIVCRPTTGSYITFKLDITYNHDDTEEEVRAAVNFLYGDKWVLSTYYEGNCK